MSKGHYLLEVGGDRKIITKCVNQGIDAHLMGFCDSKFTVVENGRLKCEIAWHELPIMIRRIWELDTELAQDLARGICESLLGDSDDEGYELKVEKYSIQIDNYLYGLSTCKYHGMASKLPPLAKRKRELQHAHTMGHA